MPFSTNEVFEIDCGGELKGELLGRGECCGRSGGDLK